MNDRNTPVGEKVAVTIMNERMDHDFANENIHYFQ